jgi:hypothetical protein
MSPHAPSLRSDTLSAREEEKTVVPTPLSRLEQFGGLLLKSR